MWQVISLGRGWRRGNSRRSWDRRIVNSSPGLALQTNAIKAKIDKQAVSSKYRLCKSTEESVSHIVCECSVLAPREHKGRHDGVTKAVHWCLCRKYGLKVAGKWYEHVSGKVRESEKVQILWDFSVQTDHQLEHNRPDLVVVDKQQAVCKLLMQLYQGMLGWN